MPLIVGVSWQPEYTSEFCSECGGEGVEWDYHSVDCPCVEHVEVPNDNCACRGTGEIDICILNDCPHCDGSGMREDELAILEQKRIRKLIYKRYEKAHVRNIADWWK